MTGNTISVTGGGSGIGGGLAEALHALRNEVIIAGRRARQLEVTAAVNAGMDYLFLDQGDAKSYAVSLNDCYGDIHA